MSQHKIPDESSPKIRFAAPADEHPPRQITVAEAAREGFLWVCAIIGVAALLFAYAYRENADAEAERAHVRAIRVHQLARESAYKRLEAAGRYMVAYDQLAVKKARYYAR